MNWRLNEMCDVDKKMFYDLIIKYSKLPGFWEKIRPLAISKIHEYWLKIWTHVWHRLWFMIYSACVTHGRLYIFFCCFKIKIESFTFEKERNNEFEILNPFWAYIKESWSTLLIEINPLYVFWIYHWIIFSEKTRKYLLATYILDHNYCCVNHF